MTFDRGSLARAARLAFAVTLLFGSTGCRCTSFRSDLDEYRCDGPGTPCPAGRICAATASGELFCLVAPDAGPCACDDGNPCNGVETCAADGGCLSGTPLDCSALDDACNAGACDPLRGACVPAPLPAGTPCDDGLFCTAPDYCAAGACGGDPRDCSGTGLPCASACDEALDSCTGMPLPTGSPCSDGTFCTVGETCQGDGSCGASTPRDCSAVADACNAGMCDEGTDLCVASPIMNGTPCTNGLFCTVGEACLAGACAGGSPRNCSALDGMCAAGDCDESADVCVAMPANGGMACSDGDSCTMGETCSGVVCAGGMPLDCSALDGMCQVGVCVGGSCTPSPVNEGMSCSDGMACTSGETCQTGACTGGVPGVEGPVGDPTCSNGADDDCDTLMDGADPQCVGCTSGCSACTSGCCDETGPGAHTCTSAGCSCNFDCGTCSSDFIANCDGGETCFIDCSGNTNNCTANCSGAGTTCIVDCSGNTNNCVVNCSAGAFCDVDCDPQTNNCNNISCTGPGTECVLRCGGSGSCDFSSCSGGAMTCPSSMNQVCGGAACP